MKALSFILSLALGLGQFAWAENGRAVPYYDEIFDRKGNIRPQYEAVYSDLVERSKSERQKFLSESLKAYSGDNKLNDVPLILTADEFDHVISPGVDQRLRAILAFLADEYSGRRSYREVLDPAVV